MKKEEYIRLYLKSGFEAINLLVDDEEDDELLTYLADNCNVSLFLDILNMEPRFEDIAIQLNLKFSFYSNFSILSRKYAESRKLNPRDWQIGYYLCNFTNPYEQFQNDLELFKANIDEIPFYIWYCLDNADKDFIDELNNQ